MSQKVENHMNLMANRRGCPARRGAIAVLAMLLLSVLIMVAAFGVELSMFMAEKAEMQRSADAAALAACWEYVAHMNRGSAEPASRDCARTVASEIAGTNLVRLQSLDADLNASNEAAGDIVFGQFDSFGNPYGEMTPQDSGVVNAVKVRLRQTRERNGEVTFTLARLLGINSKPLEVEAVASIARNVRGFRAPADNSKTVNLLPFAVKRELWDSLMAGNGDDDYSYNFDTGEVTNGSDGKREINIYPHTTGASGNSGTVDLGSSGNSNADVKRQILNGASAEDLDELGGKIELDASGQLLLNGDTGISAGMKAELNAVKGQPRVIMVYSQVTGNGNNATFTIIRFVGIRIMHVNFQGSKNNSKKLIIQPADVMAEFVIVSNQNNQTSQSVFSPARIVN